MSEDRGQKSAFQLKEFELVGMPRDEGPLE